MKIITINLPEAYLLALQTLIDFGYYPSRSEEIRIALRQFLEKELKFNEDIEETRFKKLMRGVRH